MLRKFDVAYFAASSDDLETNKKFAESLELDYPILSDPGMDVARAYGVIQGEQQYCSRHTVYIGADGKLLYIDTEVKPSSAGGDVVARLTELKVAMVE
jgi:thioredoxin-dependent peroxiredoxin